MVAENNRMGTTPDNPLNISDDDSNDDENDVVQVESSGNEGGDKLTSIEVGL